MSVVLLLGALAWGQGSGEIEVQATGYLDVGAFDVAGDGVSYDRDVGSNNLDLAPTRGYDDPAWVFWGDPWASTVNSQGEPGDIGLDRTTLHRYDGLQSGGRPTFVVNAYNQGIVVKRGFTLMRVNGWFEPRNGELGRLGDAVSLDVAYLKWTPARHADVDIYAGKIESVFGAEWWYRRAPERLGVTPSLIARYTVGTPVGVSVVGTTLRRRLGFAASLTNGNTTNERFGHFQDDIDSNPWPTATGRVSWTQRSTDFRLDVGISGQVGPQDGQPSAEVIGRQLGADLTLDIGSKMRLMAEVVDVLQPGAPGTDWLDATGAYGELAFWVSPKLAPLVRADWRNAQMRAGPNHYSSNVMRMTLGANYRVDYNLMAKVEFIRVVELLGPEIPDDVFTTSLVFQY